MQEYVITHMETAKGEPSNNSPFRLDLQTVLGLVISLQLVLWSVWQKAQSNDFICPIGRTCLFPATPNT